MEALGIDLGGQSIKGAVVDRAGRFKDELCLTTPAEQGREAVVKSIFSVVDGLIKNNKKISGIGIGTPGIIDQKTGDVIGASPNIKDWIGTPLKRLLYERYKTNIKVDNDVNAITMGEYFFGNVGKVDDLACIAIGTGIGIGVIIDKKLFRRSHEMGHTIVDFDGPTCGCKRQGCLESIVSAVGLVQQYKLGRNNEAKEEITPEFIFRRGLKENDPYANKIIDNFISALASVMVNMILSFSITNFIITGGVSHSLPLFKNRLIREILGRSISHLRKVTINRGLLDNHAGILGAASLVFSEDT